MKKYIKTDFVNDVLLGISIGLFCLAALMCLLYIGFGGTSFEYLEHTIFWVSLVLSLGTGYIIIRLWRRRSKMFDASDAFIIFIIALLSFWASAALGRGI